MSLLVVGDGGVARCAWATSAPDYVAYHDDEWGRRVRGERELFERLTLESFQSGLSWLTILRKREAFRAAFVGFEPDVVAALGVADVERLMGDASIVRNRRKIEAAVTNARAVVELRADGGLEALIDTFPPAAHERPTTVADVVGSSDESTGLAKELKRRGFAHVGPTTCYSLMQACGYVNDHAAGCVVGDAIERLAG